jgi:hypothetical protein
LPADATSIVDVQKDQSPGAFGVAGMYEPLPPTSTSITLMPLPIVSSDAVPCIVIWRLLLALMTAESAAGLVILTEGGAVSLSGSGSGPTGLLSP